MAKIVECVPNFSEGIAEATITAIADAVRATPGASLLDVDPGKSTNRTVYTFVGSPDAVLEAALSAAKVAFSLIDMRRHKGEHPRMGALDVCPFVPVSGVTVEECVMLAQRFGARLAEELDVPVYLYGAAATAAYRATMPQIRAGEYEGLADKLARPEWRPDYGPARLVPSWGATVTGVRKFLIAYNINMVATKEQAHSIALNLREKGRGGEGQQQQAGRLKAVQGIGWWLAEANIAQISLNLTDMDVTPMHVAYEEAKKDATAMGLAVTGSEVVGLIPLAALLDAAEFYIKAEGLMILEEDQKVHLAINRLGLSTLAPFKPAERVIEYCLAAKQTTSGRLKDLTVADFVKSVGARTAAPGGGSVAALVGGLGCALAAMVGKLSYGRKQWAAIDGQMREVLPRLHGTMLEVIEMIDRDTEAFNAYMAAMKRPKATEAEVAEREAAMQKAIENAIQVPLNLAIKLNTIWPCLDTLAACGNMNCRSDLEVSARCLETGVQGAIHNVDTNLASLKEADLRQKYENEGRAEVKTAELAKDRVLKAITDRAATQAK